MADHEYTPSCHARRTQIIPAATLFLYLFVVVIECTSPPCIDPPSAGVESNQTYDWSTCNATTTPWTVVSGAQHLSNVVIRISGGADLPRFDFSMASSLVNVSIVVEGYAQPPTSLPISHPLVILPLSCTDVQIFLHSCQIRFDGTTPPGPSFIGHKIGDEAAFLSNVDVTIESCTLNLTLAGQSLVEFQLANNSNGVSVVVENSTIVATTSDVDVTVLQSIDIGPRCNVVSDIVFRMERSTITFIQNCSNASSVCGNSSNLQKSTSAVVHWDAPNAVMIRSVVIVRDSVVIASLASPSNETDATRMSRSMTLLCVEGSFTCLCSLPQLTVDVSNITASISFGWAATLLRLEELDEMSDAVITVEDSEVTFSAHGALNSGANTRYTTVIHISNNTVGPNLTIRMTRVIATMNLLSGEKLPSAIASSPLTITYATLLYISAGIKKPVNGLSTTNTLVVVVVRDCRATVDISNGSLTFHRLPPSEKIPDLGHSWPSFSMYTMMSTLVLIDRQHEVSANMNSVITKFIARIKIHSHDG